MSGWGLPEQEITFTATGRTAIVRDPPNVYAIFGADDLAPYLDDFKGGSLSDAAVGMRITEEICRSQMVSPRILARDEAAPEGTGSAAIEFGALDTSEVDELLERWKEAVSRPDRFRTDAAGDGARAGGKGVGAKSKPRARAASGKS